MERKIVLEIEELEERIAPHAYLGMGNSEVWSWKHGPSDPVTHLLLPNGTELQIPGVAYTGINVANG